MKCAIIFTHWMEIEDGGNRNEIEEIIREKNLNVTLRTNRYGGIEITSENFRDLWMLLFYISNKSDWEIM